MAVDYMFIVNFPMLMIPSRAMATDHGAGSAEFLPVSAQRRQCGVAGSDGQRGQKVAPGG